MENEKYDTIFNDSNFKKMPKISKAVNSNEKRGLPNISLSYLIFLKAYLPYLCSIVKYVILNATMDI